MTRRDPLATLLRLRQAALDETRQALATAYRAERDACALVDRAMQVLSQEADAATNLRGGDEAVENYVRWLPVGRRAVERAREEQRLAGAELDRTRTLLVLARAAVRAVEFQIDAAGIAATARSERRIRDDDDEAGRTAVLRHAGERG